MDHVIVYFDAAWYVWEGALIWVETYIDKFMTWVDAWYRYFDAWYGKSHGMGRCMAWVDVWRGYSDAWYFGT